MEGGVRAKPSFPTSTSPSTTRIGNPCCVARPPGPSPGFMALNPGNGRFAPRAPSTTASGVTWSLSAATGRTSASAAFRSSWGVVGAGIAGAGASPVGLVVAMLSSGVGADGGAAPTVGAHALMQAPKRRAVRSLRIGRVAGSERLGRREIAHRRRDGRGDPDRSLTGLRREVVAPVHLGSERRGRGRIPGGEETAEVLTGHVGFGVERGVALGEPLAGRPHRVRARLGAVPRGRRAHPAAVVVRDVVAPVPDRALGVPRARTHAADEVRDERLREDGRHSPTSTFSTAAW